MTVSGLLGIAASNPEESNMLKFSIVLASFALTFGLSAAADSSSVYVIELDWSNPKTLKDNIVQQCSDDAISHVDIVVPGKPRKDFYVEMPVDISKGKISPGCSVKMKEGATSTTYSIDAVNGGCTIRVEKIRTMRGDKVQTAVYEIGDHC